MSVVTECLRHHVALNQSVWLWGPPGIGKTQLPHQLVTEPQFKGFGAITWLANLRDPVDARGLPVPDLVNETTKWLKPSELPIEGNKAFPEKGVIVFDELNTASPAMMNVALGMVLERRVGEHKLKPGWVPIATGNRMKDRVAVQRVGTALKDRFFHYDIEPDIEAWSKHANQMNIDPRLVAFLRFRCGKRKDGQALHSENFLHRMPKDDTDNSMCTPRGWFEVDKVIKLKVAQGIRLHMIAAKVGYDVATELEGFLRVFEQLPSLQDVVNNPAGAKMPPDTMPAAKYAVSSLIARSATKQTFKPIIEYAQRLDREFEVMTVVDACRRDEELTRTQAYVQWAVNNQDLHM